MTTSESKHRLMLFLVMLLLGLASCKETLLHNLDERQANQIKVSLARVGIASEKVFDGTSWAIQVAAENETKALATLEENRLLKRNLEDGLETSQSLIPSREERARAVERQVSIQLEQTLERLPYVLEARVHLSLAVPNRVELEDKGNSGTASILLIVTPSTIEQQLFHEEKIKKLVAGASGVDVNRVTVVVELGEEAARLPSPPVLTAKSDARSSALGQKLLSRPRDVLSLLLVPLGVVLLLCAVLLKVVFNKQHVPPPAKLGGKPGTPPHAQKAKPYRRSKDMLSPQQENPLTVDKEVMQ